MKSFDNILIIFLLLFSVTAFSLDSSINLLAPFDGETGVSTDVEFVWNEVESASHYIYVVSTNPDFLPENSSEFITEDTINIRTFPANTVLYWKVKALVSSSYTDFSEVFAFQTLITDCSEFTIYPNIDIIDDNIYSTITIDEDFSLSDINVFLDIDHTYVGDLIVNLISPLLTINLIDNPGIPASTYGCSNDDIIVTIDDQAELGANILEVMCSDTFAAIFGEFQSKDLGLSNLTGTSSSGDWILEIIDTYAGEDFGVLNEWSIELCGDAVEPQPYSFNHSPITAILGGISSISSQNILFQEDGINPSEFVYTIIELPQYGQILIDDITASVGSSFTQDMVNQGLIKLIYDIAGADSDSFVMDITSSSGNWIHNYEQDINVTDEFVGMILETYNVYCFGESTGSVVLTAFNGVPPYTYSIDGVNYSENPIFSNLSEGDYTFYIKDSDLTVITVATSIFQPEFPLGISVDQYGNDIVCNGEGGVPPYQFSVDGGAYSSIISYFDLTDDTHIISVIDNNLCEFSQEITISSLYLSVYTSEEPICFDSDDGEVILSLEGGIAPHQFRVDNGEWQSSILFQNLSAGNHIFEVMDGNGNTYSFDYYIAFPPEMIISGSISDNSITVDVSGGVPPYLYSINGFNYVESNIFENLSYDNHTIWVYDSNGCIKTYDFLLVSNDDISENDFELNIYPNPNQGKFTFVANGVYNNIVLTCYNSTGQKIFVKSFDTINNSLKEDINFDLANGIYLIHAKSSNLNSYTKMMIE